MTRSDINQFWFVEAGLSGHPRRKGCASLKFSGLRKILAILHVYK